jgi:protein SCO1/2
MSPAAAAPSAKSTPSAFDPKVLQIDEARHLGTPLDGQLELVDATGRPFALREMLGKPLVLVLSYYSCDGSCTIINQQVAEAVMAVRRFELGRDYRLLTVSFDRQDSTEAARGFAQKTAARAWEGWRHAILANRERDVSALTGAVGFRYFWSQPDRAFVHPNVLIFLTPEGRIARYLYGTAFDARSIELALIDADWGRIANSASIIDMMTGVCFSYNYLEGKYQPNYPLLIGTGSLLFGVSLMVLGAVMYRRRLGRANHVSA